MRSADTLRRRAPRRARTSSIFLAASLVCAACALSLAQSGRTPTPPADPPAARPGDSRPRQVNQRPRRLPSAFVVASAPPDGSQETSPYVGPGYGHLDFEELARGGCLAALKNLRGVRVVEDVNVARWEARETALGEDEAYVVWLELTWTQAVTRDAAPFRLRYLLLEPRTGRLVSSGYGRGVRRTWGRPAPRVDIDEQLRNAGRDVADQIVSELSAAP